MSWRTIRRETGLIEHACEHGTGHPNYYSAQRMNGYVDVKENTWLIHGCDGCCSRFDFPGRKMGNGEIVNRLRGVLDTVEQTDADWIDIIRDINQQAGFALHDLMVNEGLIRQP